jgi:hypothetical protein
VEAGGGALFEKGRLYTRAQIHAALGGSRRAALPTKGGKVVCLCLTRERNPRAPAEMVLGGHERSVRLARDLAGSGAAVPAFVRAPGGGWGYAGERRVRAVVDEPGALLALVAEGAPADASLALLLEEPPIDPGWGPGDESPTAPQAKPATAGA